MSLVLSASAAFAQAPASAPASAASAPVVAGSTTAPVVAARAWILYDMTSRQVLAELNPQQSVEPASLTKLMTAYLSFEALKLKKLALDQRVSVSALAQKQEGSRMFLDVRVPVSIKDLLHGMIVQSGNDASIALAEAAAGSVERFVEQMNAQAQRMGLTQTSFKNVTGLPAAGHVTSARDLVKLSVALIQDFPEYYAIYAQKEFSYNSITQPNRNLLLFRDPSVDGLKTGHTESAGYCLVATAKKAGPSGDRRMLSVMLGTASENARAQESQKLLNWGYASFDAVKLFEAEVAIETPRIWKGAQNTVKLGALQPLFVSVPKGSAARVKTAIVRAEPLLAPLAKGDKAGVIKVTLDGQTIAEQPVAALESVPAASVLGRAWDALRLWLK